MMNPEFLHPPVVCYQDTLERLGGKEPLYERMLRKVPEDTSLADAQTAFAAHNRSDFALYIHALRGLALNLGFASLAELAEQMDKHLRGASYSDEQFLREEEIIAQQLAELSERYDTVLKMLQQALGG